MKENRLKELRGEISQARIAALFDTKQQTWGSWESGRTLPPPAMMQRMEDYFAVRKESIFFAAFNYKNNLSADGRNNESECQH